MKYLKIVLAAALLGLALPLAATAGEQAGNEKPAPQAQTAAAPSTPAAKCLEAVVNPVTGSAFCTNPRGAPVDPPSRASLNRPCKPRAHDDDAFTVYEHYSGCDD